MNNQILADIESQVQDKTETFRDLFRQQFRGLTHGTRELRGDVEFLTWYQMMMERDPLWVHAIATFPEGRRMNLRYLRLKGFMQEGSDVRVE